MNYEKRPVNIPEWSMYQVDTEGNVYNRNGTLKKYSVNHSGYAIITFCVNKIKRSYAIHTIVAKTFLPDPGEGKWQVNHKDGNKLNNRLDNLEWVTAKENVEHAIKVLGHDNLNDKNPNARKIIAYNSKTKETLYFNSFGEAAEFLTEKFSLTASRKSIRCQIWKALRNYDHHNTYKGYTWYYNDNKVVKGPKRKEISSCT